MDWKPKRWIALILGVLIPPTALLYTGSWRWALAYALTLFGLMLLALFAIPAGDQGPVLVNLLQFVLIIVVVWHAFARIKDYERGLKRPWYSRWNGIIAIYLGFVLPILLTRTFVFEPYRLPSASMEPEFPRTSQIAIEKFGYGNYDLFGISVVKTRMTKTLHHGDAVVFRFPQDPHIEYMKRVVGLPGDHVEYRNKALWVNGRQIPQAFLHSNTTVMPGMILTAFDMYEESFNGRTWRIQKSQMTPAQDFAIDVPAGMYFVMGDNRDFSNDSRFWGYVPESNIKGKVIYRF